jgi:catechol 2,3-dioxygenase-like lactoylglutathione lyase family enzyme
MLNISGIQQIGIGVTDVYEAWKFYRYVFGIDIPVLDDISEARFMLRYTGGLPHERHAVLAINIQGGGGFEIWQYTKRPPVLPGFSIMPGDIGINYARIRCKKAADAFSNMEIKGIKTSGKIYAGLDGKAFFYCSDPYENIFQVIEDDYRFKDTICPTGGISGAAIGVSDADRSVGFYSGILGYNNVVYDKSGFFDDLNYFGRDECQYRRILLKHGNLRKGAFSRLLGPSQIELIQASGRKPRKIYENRFWGDPGFIHLCFDVFRMDDVISHCINNGFPVTVDSSSGFKMGNAAGHFIYIEDPDGTLIEFVETFRIPVIKKIGWYIDLKNRNPEKPLPDWMLKALVLNRV